MLKKYKGFKIKEVERFSDLFVKRKNISVFFDLKNIYHFYSYNDNGYKICAKNSDFNIGLKDIISQATTELKKLDGFIIVPRISQHSKMKLNTIYWWEKGYDRLNNGEHYKCEVLSSEGYPVESTGLTLKEACENLISELKGIESDYIVFNKFEKLPFKTQERLQGLSDDEFEVEFDKL